MNTKTAVGCFLFGLSCTALVSAETLEWARQLGTDSQEDNITASADGLGNVYVSGTTRGSLVEPHVGRDVFISKYDADGTLLWTQQLGTSIYEYNRSLSADRLGSVYVSGDTWGSLGGPNPNPHPSSTPSDAFISKYDASGVLQPI